MPEYLEATVDKFIFRVATDRLYRADGIWILAAEFQDATESQDAAVLPENGLVRIGLSDYLQQHSGDVAFVHPKTPGTKLAIGDICAEIETIKTTFDLISPLAGEIVEVNSALETTPEIINQDPYGQGWLAVIKAENFTFDRSNLLEPNQYFSLMRKQAEEELNAS
jgi:glycine cleavage system H protein